jgi:DNA-binding MarR family transcriptional regulator
MSQSSESIDLLIGQVCRMHYKRAHTLLEALGLYRGQPHVLSELWRQEGLTHSELATHKHVSPATITKMIQRMEEAGFVERRPDPRDQRVSRVYLTPAGREIQQRVFEVWQQLEKDTLGDLVDEERAVLRRLLIRIRDNLTRASGENPCF